MMTEINKNKSIIQQKIISIDAALNKIKSKSHVVTSMAAAQPTMFFENFHQVMDQLDNVTVHCANPSQKFPCFTRPDGPNNIEFDVMFLTSAVRSLQGSGTIHYVPQHLSNWAQHLFTRHPVEVFWGSCSVPDERGFVSLGTGACYEAEVLDKAKTVILEVNPNMPVTFGATHVPIANVDYFVESTAPLPTTKHHPVDPIDRQIGQLVADLIEDGSTLQLGIGGIPNAVASALESKSDLGIHTEMINDAMMQLYERGIVTGAKKSIWPGKIVGAFVFGSQELYKFVHKNPIIELQPASVVNDPYRIGRNNKMTSINTAIELDLAGQVCSESLGHTTISGVGGAAETHIGAQRSKGGRGIIAMHSRTASGTPKIVPALKPGAKVSISQNDIDTVVTEYGVAHLAGRNLVERSKQLISIAHPEDRDKLEAIAQEFKYF